MSEIDLSTIGKRLKYARKFRGLKQDELADRCGWKYQSRITAYERDAREPGADEIAQLAQALEISRAWLATGEGNMLLGVSAATPALPAEDAKAAPSELEMAQSLLPKLPRHAQLRAMSIIFEEAGKAGIPISNGTDANRDDKTRRKSEGGR